MPKSFEDRIDALQGELTALHTRLEGLAPEDPSRARLEAQAAALRRSIRWYSSRLGSRHAHEAWLAARRSTPQDLHA